MGRDQPSRLWVEVTYQSQYAYFFTNRGFGAADVYSDAVWQKTGELLPFLKNS